MMTLVKSEEGAHVETSEEGRMLEKRYCCLQHKISINLELFFFIFILAFLISS